MGKKIVVLGSGNLLYKDEGVGVHVAQDMQKLDLPDNVRVVECGTTILDAAEFIEKADRLIVVDAVKGGGKPGTIYKFKDKDISEYQETQISLHQISLLKALDMIAMTSKRRPSATVIGVEPKDLGPGLALSPEISEKLPRIIEVVLKEIEEDNVRAKLLVSGIVQGVGFRPFIYRLADEHELKGYISNTSHGVDIEVEGGKDSVESFIEDIRYKHPPLAHITDIKTTYLETVDHKVFEIRESKAEKDRSVLISPDISLCEDCLNEVFDPDDRRYLYPFINCTNCGPRYTIIKDIPYDRNKTSMREFLMCRSCDTEYHDPMNRRFHAQPNACHVCGPHVKLADADGNEVKTDDPIGRTIEFLKEGKIMAIKGLGGYHLAVDATNDPAVRTLRERKRREEKPLAMMCLNIETLEKFAEVNKVEEAILHSPQRPIVLLRKKANTPIAGDVSPRNKHFGVMLPYTPLHYMILRNKEDGTPNFLALVMTSGNISEEPIAIDNREAQVRLQGIADYYLTHNRDIYLRSDDSLLRVIEKKTMLIRRSRGFVPIPVFVRDEMEEILACGPELKNTICLTKGRNAFISQHIGDLENLETMNFFELTVGHLEKILQIKPKIIVYDLHPEYLSTKFALEQKGVELMGIPHHQAHIASCMAENGLDCDVIGIALDGTGYGEDGNIWGGEVFTGNLKEFERVAHFEYVPMPGGAKAIKEPWRMTLSYLYHAFKKELKDPDLEFFQRIDGKKVDTIVKMINNKINCPLTSSCGRVFDGVSSLIGIRDTVVYEGQAAMELEMAIEEGVEEHYMYDFCERDGKIIIVTGSIFRQIIEDLVSGQSKNRISAKFHNCLVNLFVTISRRLRKKTGLDKVVLSGGVFQNVYLTIMLEKKLSGEGFKVYTHSKVPPNDGGISLGQAVLANRRKRR